MRIRKSSVTQSVDRACLFLFIATAISAIVRYAWTEANDPQKCNALLTRGRWLDPPGSSASGPVYQNWQPQGCILHKYQPKDMKRCFENRRIVFIGDSTIRQIFWATARKLDRQHADEQMEHVEQHADLTFAGGEAANVTVNFFWDPYLNSTHLRRELAMAALEESDVADNNTAIVLAGGGLWHAKQLGEFSLQRFSESIESLFHVMGAEKASPSPLWKLPQHWHPSTLIALAPVQIPLYDSLDHPHAETLTPDRVDPMNDKISQVWEQRRLPVLWALSPMTLHQPEAYQSGGLHATNDVAATMADVLFNAKCNTWLTQNERFPLNKTCCTLYPQLDLTQHAFLIAAWLLVMYSLIIATFTPSVAKLPWKHSRRSKLLKRIVSGLTTIIPPQTIVKAATVMTLACGYCFYADRTQVWNKVQKMYTTQDFAILCSITLVLGFISIRPSTPVRRMGSPPKAAPVDTILSRDQTDEWKGWMQFIILIYHYTGASKTLWIYEIVRVLVAAYLFLTGYGHAVFYYKKDNYSLKRVASVLIRINMLSCILPYVMKTEYMFYYFSPLISFWYLVVYTTMAVGKSYNKSLNFLITKILVAAAITSVMIQIPSVFNTLFSLLDTCCSIRWDVHEWRFRLHIDAYIVYIGMLFGILCARFPADIPSDRLPRYRSLYTIYTFATPTVLICYIYIVLFTETKEEHNAVFPFVSAFPILTYILLRNSFKWTRRYYSSIFAWIGRHSLETFVLQFHIWLAADTKGLLSTGLFERYGNKGRWLDFALLTPLFLWVCWYVADATQVLTAWIVEHGDGGAGPAVREGVGRRQEEGGALLSPREDMEGGAVPRWFDSARASVVGRLWARLLLILLVLWGLNRVG